LTVSALLEKISLGEARAAHELLPLVYDELRRLAAFRLRKLPPGQTLQPTALVHEVFLELVGRGDPGWDGRRHFFGAAARAMHDILVDQARRKSAKKRDAGKRVGSFDESAVLRTVGTHPDDVIALSRALDKLRIDHPRRAEVAMLKTFAGLTEGEIAEIHEVTERTVERDWRFAQAFLLRELEK
jgi:RNA polymerase sigma factor (TIGR02999 family)